MKGEINENDLEIAADQPSESNVGWEGTSVQNTLRCCTAVFSKACFVVKREGGWAGQTPAGMYHLSGLSQTDDAAFSADIYSYQVSHEH